MTDDSILDKIESPSDLKELSDEERTKLAFEIREEIVNTVAKNGGHLASNLGVVELTIAIHSVFNCPEDKIVWDVGHQSYAHKLLTGRKNMLHTIRTEGGLSGFPKRSESEYDSFNTGHSSTSVSAALGISAAGTIRDDKYYTIAVIGDGALSGGLALEGINVAGRTKENLIVILNDNKMSISKNVGSMARYLTKIRIKPSYINAKVKVRTKLKKLPHIGKKLARFFSRCKSWIRLNFFGHQKNMFEQLGFRYYGPLDGHDIGQLCTAMEAAKHSKGPVMLHVCTKKGMGYEFAEKNPKNYHGISAFDIETGEPKSSSVGYSDVFGEYMCDRAEKDPSLCAITAAMAIGTGLSEFAKNYKNRFFDVGIAEEHAVTFASGLAAANARPVFAVYSTFLQRSYDEILHDAAMQGLHIVIAVDRAGVVGEDGETHQGVFDTAFLNTIPDITVFAPSSFDELRKMMDTAIYALTGVAAVRYPRGGELPLPEDYSYNNENYTFYGNEKSDILVVTYGRLFSFACDAMNKLKQQGIDICILKLDRIKPIDPECIKDSEKFKNVFFFEEGIKTGGIGECFGFMLYNNGYRGNYNLTAIEGYVKQAKVDSALHKLGLDCEGMIRTITEVSDKRGDK